MLTALLNNNDVYSSEFVYRLNIYIKRGNQLCYISIQFKLQITVMTVKMVNEELQTA